MNKDLEHCKILDATCGSRTIWFTKDSGEEIPND